MTRLLHILRWPFLWLWRWLRPTKLRWTSMFVADLPAAPEPTVVYLIGEDNQAWFAALLCPCGCNDVIHLSLLDHDRPRWRATYEAGSPTLYPSVWRRRGCGSHFFLTDGHIRWVAGDTPVERH